MILFYLLIFIMPMEKHPLWGQIVGALTLTKYLGGACLLVALMHLAQRRGMPKFLGTPQAKWMTVLIFMSTISFLINGAGLNIEMSNVISYWSFLLLLVVTVALVDTVRRFYWTLFVAIAGVAWASQYMIREWVRGVRLYGGAFRPGWVVGDSNYFGVNTLLCLPIAFMFFRSAKKPWERLFSFGCICLILAATMVGASRGTLLGLLLMCGYLVMRSKKRVTYTVLIMALLIPFLLLSPVSPVKRLLSPTKSDVEASEARIYGWQAGLRMIQEHPIIGIGLGNYKPKGHEYDPTGHLARIPHIAHNAYLEIASEMGIPTFLVFVMMLVTMFRSLSQTRQSAEANGPEFIATMALGMQAGLLGACVALFFVSGQYQKMFWLMLCLTMCMPVFIGKEAKAERRVPVEEEPPVFAGNPMLLDEADLWKHPVVQG